MIKITLEDAQKYKGVALIMVALIRQKGWTSVKESELWTGATRLGIYKAARDNGIFFKNGIFTL